ncbi:hypothetical protein BD289DRAFT_458148 [Coniella lustricola]|uniref:Uncharacterized protein n=1 Tax=Coniella lustricola TaxID=2025994 RepID=A0A2T3AKU4_9PEZI|nr:hypothetical protein BD289DRAFT_458148 [Coniella lustricola]
MSSTVHCTTNRPRTRQRIQKAPNPLTVPNIQEDAAERKRVLNVLAQRRYQSNEPASATTCGSTNSVESSPRVDGQLRSSDTVLEPLTPESAESGSSELDANAVSWDMVSSFDTIGFESLGNWFNVTSGSASEAGSRSPPRLSPSDSSTVTSAQGISLPITIDSTSICEPSRGGGRTAQANDAFQDSYVLPVLELTLLRAFLRIAARLGCATTSIWDINTRSTFSDPLSSTLHLPKTWQPTTAQLLIPHHPILDILPWPSVREKILYTFTLPEDLRPPVAQSPTALVQFSYDLEDSAEGVRIWGEDVYDPRSWEVGQVFFEKWWFLFDSDIIKQSNYWRERRGAAKLRIASGHGE